MKRVHVIVVVVLLVILFGFMFFMRKKERYSSDASVFFGSPTPAPGSTIRLVENVNSFGSTIGSPTPAHVMYSEADRTFLKQVEPLKTALKQNTSLNQNEITTVVDVVSSFVANPTSDNLSQIKRLPSVYAGKFPDEKEKKDKLNQAIAPLVSPGIEKMTEKNHTVSGTNGIYECSSDGTGFACKLHTL